MTSASSRLSTSDATPDLRRLCLKPDAPATGSVDGAWWPASRDLAAELPAVMDAVAGRLGRVEAVSYNIDAWEAAPRKARIGGDVVRMSGFHTQAHDTVDVLGARRRLTLLVVPPDTEPAAAQAALAAAGREGNVDDVAALLINAGSATRTSEQ
jgi:hypothetical protein